MRVTVTFRSWDFDNVDLFCNHVHFGRIEVYLASSVELFFYERHKIVIAPLIFFPVRRVQRERERER